MVWLYTIKVKEVLFDTEKTETSTLLQAITHTWKNNRPENFKCHWI